MKRPKAVIRIDAFAKVNLYLHVCGKRDNGYHELDSLVVFAKTGDELTFKLEPDLKLEISGPQSQSLPSNSNDNLVMKAALLLKDRFGVKAGAHIHLIKNLPVASGIGGGSVDAAACLCGLCDLWHLQPTYDELNEIALVLGADVPISIASRAAHLGGIGETLTPFEGLPDLWTVLVNPLIEVSTPQVFQTREGEFRKANPLVRTTGTDVFLEALKTRDNDLATPAIKLVPVIGDIITALKSQTGCELARMSGSGASCFGLFLSQKDAETAATELKRTFPDWWVSPAAGLS